MCLCSFCLFLWTIPLRTCGSRRRSSAYILRPGQLSAAAYPINWPFSCQLQIPTSFELRPYAKRKISVLIIQLKRSKSSISRGDSGHLRAAYELGDIKNKSTSPPVKVKGLWSFDCP
ncbi:hypothetical protein BDV11DRAFT_200505 [Aspergillus similis]